MDFTEHPHRRKNILTGEWVLVSPHRTKRPWQGKTENIQADSRPSYDPNCYLCPGNQRAGGKKNPDYQGTYSFVNDFSALLADSPIESTNEKDLLIAEGDAGICKVLCFSPRHDLTMAKMSVQEITEVIDLWQREFSELSSKKGIQYVQIFENRGDIMGCSNPHPHGQIWSNYHIPEIPLKESREQAKYHQSHGSCMLCDYLALELEKGERVVYENSSLAILVPFWAVWPYELLVLPKRHQTNILEMGDSEKADWAEGLRILGIKYDNLFSTSFPYSMGIHQAPVDGKNHDSWHFHLHYYPPLLRSATVKKFMVGYEMLAQPQRDITAEMSAKTLRELPTIHHTEKN